MSERDIDNTVYCDLQMPLELGVELLQLVNELRAAGQHPNLDEIFRQMQHELTGSIEFVASGSPWMGQPDKPKN